MRRFVSWVASKLPRRDIVGSQGLYLSRFCIFGWMPDRPWPYALSCYLHRFVRPDADRELHNHPWKYALSVILVGGYTEERYGPYLRIDKRVLRPFSINFIKADTFHRVATLHEHDCWSLFFTFKKSQTWGFKGLDGRFVNHRDFVSVA